VEDSISTISKDLQKNHKNQLMTISLQNIFESQLRLDWLLCMKLEFYL
jgi:hypothetical protein